jgi:hypothetical protein
MVKMTNYPDKANQAYIMRDSAEEELEESPPWWVLLVILMSVVLLFLTVTFEHDFF